MNRPTKNIKKGKIAHSLDKYPTLIQGHRLSLASGGQWGPWMRPKFCSNLLYLQGKAPKRDTQFGGSVKATTKLILSAAMSFSLGANGSIPTHLVIKQSDFVLAGPGYKELDLGYINNLVQMARTELKMSTAELIPINMKATNDGGRVAQEILGHAISRLMERSDWEVSRSIREIEAPLNQNAEIKSRDGTTHGLGVKVNAARSTASLNYSGLVEAKLSYQLSSQSLNLELAHKLSKASRLIFNHSQNEEETLDVIAVVAHW